MAENLHNIGRPLGVGPEFIPGELDAGVSAFDRRTFLKLMSATVAAAAAAQAGCSRPQPAERIVPYVRSPEHVIPGLPTFYASTLPTSGFASGFGRGVLVESHEGRPTKIEGNPAHPSTLGGSDIFMQAAVLQLYDQSRSTTLLHREQPAEWGGLFGELTRFIAQRGGPKNVRVRLLTRTLTSPTLAAQLRALHAAFPLLIHHVDDPLGAINSRMGLVRALGRPLTPRHNFARATRIISLDNQFLSSIENPGALRYAREFAGMRSPGLDAAEATLSRVYMAESTLSFTGARADHRVAVTPGMILHLAVSLAEALQGQPDTTQLPTEIKKWIAAAAQDLQSHPRESLILVGECQPPEVHALAATLNERLLAPGNTLEYMDAIEIQPGQDGTLASLTRALNANEVDLLVMVDCNPAFTAPGDLKFADALARFGADSNHLALHMGAYVDETACLCPLHIPLSHPLESWLDFRAHDGAASICQPLIEPLWNSKTPTELFAALLAIASEKSLTASSYDLLRQHWLDQWKDRPERERAWRKALRDGVIENSAAEPVQVSLPDPLKVLADLQGILQPIGTGIELALRLDPTLADGEAGWANHPWLQELPKPFSHSTWDNLALISPATALAIGLREALHEARETVPIVRIAVGADAIEIPVWIQAGHPDNTITLHMGSGHAIGDIQKGVGTNVYPLRTTAALWHRAGGDVHIADTGRRTPVACTQAIQSQQGRGIARSRRIEEGSSESPFQKTAKKVPLSLYKDYPYTGYKWGMVIDLSTCMGCSACVIACQAENNIPTVGKEQVRRGRVMHWIRIDTYQEAGIPEFQFQPMLCQHCENAPCEVVCPVEATSHSDEGINEMTYNRCVGTRYCSNNCPYKVRRFNFFNYNSQNAEGALSAMQKNPNVTVRSRGVMEKCTYCIQRINRARLGAKRDWSRSEQPLGVVAPPEMRTIVKIDPGSERADAIEVLPRLQVQTACQQACPARAITFGDLNDADSAVHKLKSHPRNYGVLTELNTQPRTTYLERLTNPNPAIADATPSLPEQRGGAA